ncbi:MAG: HEPN domain-containing protein [archaeon]
MIEEFEYYLDKQEVVRKTADPAEANSLITKASNRLKYIKTQEISEENADFIFEDIYECMREAVQALMSNVGYKPYSHTVLVAFLKEFTEIPNQDAETFDRLRKLRNNAIYSAEAVSIAECQDALEFLTEFLPKIKNELKKNTG